MSNWQISHRFDNAARVIADRHYNRQKPGTPQFVPPGRCLVLKIPNSAFWVTSWPFPEFTKHAWRGAWICSAFRNERPDLYLSSVLIKEAVAITRSRWDAPDLGIVTFVDASQVASKNPGYCYKQAGFRQVGNTKGGLIALQMLPAEMPDPIKAIGQSYDFFDALR